MTGDSQLQVLLFGPGYGECLLIHLGAGQWMIVDSCRDPRGGQPALEHLTSIGAVPETDVRLVVASHWHDDHVAGLAEVVERCASANFLCSLALRSEEFLTLVLAGSRAPARWSGVSEFARILEILEARKLAAPTWAVGARRVWVREQDPPAEVWALSPSDEAVNRSLSDFGHLLDEQRGPVRRQVRAVNPNHASVVLWVRVRAHAALLSADLEKHAHAGLGWEALIDDDGRPLDRADLFKVAHHGARNGDDPRIWDELLTNGPVACVTPFTRGRVPRPQPSDLTRLCQRAQAVYQTAPATRPLRRRRAPPVERTIQEVAEELRRLEPPPGCAQLQPRGPRPDDGWDATLAGSAFEACEHH